MKYSFPYKAHFQRNALTYICLIGVIVTGYVFMVKSKSALRKHQKFNIFVAAQKVETNPFKEKINSYIDNDSIKEIIINACNPNNLSFYTMYSTFGLEDADILILNSNKIVNNDLKSKFVYFNEESIYYNETNYINNDVHYGLELFKNNTGYLSNYISYEKDNDYYLFVNKKSKHLLGLTTDTKGKTNSVKKVLGGIFNG